MIECSVSAVLTYNCKFFKLQQLFCDQSFSYAVAVFCNTVLC